MMEEKENKKDIGKAMVFIESMVWAFVLGFENGKEDGEEPNLDVFEKALWERFGDMEMGEIIPDNFESKEEK